MSAGKTADVRWGIYDTQDNCWVGDHNGPRIYDRAWLEKTNREMGLAGDKAITIDKVELMAKASAQIINAQAGYHIGRLRARPFTAELVVFKDDVPQKMGPLEAVQKLEEAKIFG